MKLLFTLLSAILALAAEKVGDTNDCTINPNEKYPHPADCCKMPGVVSMLHGINFHKCAGRIPKELRIPTTGIFNRAPKLPISRHLACIDECIFSELHLLDADKNLDKAAVKTLYSSGVSKAVAPVVESVVDTCLKTYKNDFDEEQECKSGAGEFFACKMYNVFINCPASNWVDSAECGALKEKVQKCPTMQVVLAKSLPKGTAAEE